MKALLKFALATCGLVATPAHADVWVYGNGATLDVLIFGNAADSDQQMAERAFAITREGWHLLWQGDPDQRGWIGVSCIRRSDGGVQLEFVTEQPDRATAEALLKAASDQYIARHDGTMIAGCGAMVANNGQVLAEVVRYLPPRR